MYVRTNDGIQEKLFVSFFIYFILFSLANGIRKGDTKKDFKKKFRIFCCVGRPLENHIFWH